MKTKIMLIIWALFQLPNLNTYSQTAYVTIENIAACDSTEITVAVNLEDFINIGAVTLFIGFDTTNLDFIAIENIHNQFSGLIYNLMQTPEPQIGISWTGVEGTNVASGKIFDLKFHYTAGSANIFFNNNCEVSTNELDIINMEYTGGLVSPSIEILQQPEGQIVNEPEEAFFSVQDEGGENFQWQKSNDGGSTFINLENSAIFQDVNAPQLWITATTDELNNNIFRCEISNANCQIQSEGALLTVLPEIYTQTVELTVGWNSYATYLLPAGTAFEEVFAPILSSIEIISDGDGIYDPASGLNTIGDFDPYQGYVIKLKSTKMFDLSGYDKGIVTLQIPVGTSWLPVLSSCNVTVDSLLGGHISQVEIIRELPGLTMVWPAQDISTLTYLKPGKTYLIEATSNFEISFPPCQ
jgi:hypothetical protein